MPSIVKHSLMLPDEICGMTDLIAMYNVPAPRYTSYPSVVHWDKAPTPAEWLRHATECYLQTHHEGIGLYVHLPFCESLCTYCACNTRITVNHAVEEPYLRSIAAEWQIYRQAFGEKIRVTQLHLGGGTPTFFSPQNLDRLCTDILAGAVVTPGADLSFEGHPVNTTKEHLETLYHRGFRRVSYGIQDFDTHVQKLIHRIQPLDCVVAAVKNARDTGYTSVNFDLVYGLPGQTDETMAATINEVIKLRPDRIAFYSYAHVPWLKPAQRAFEKGSIPNGDSKLNLYRIGRNALIAAGYRDVGLDHFALPGDSLYQAATSGSLHRNFMGYTTNHSKLTIGLGASAISDSWTAFAQNAKNVEVYGSAVRSGSLPIIKGHLLSARDLTLREQILELMCRKETLLDRQTASDAEVAGRLRALESDGLISYSGSNIEVTKSGERFMRNICLAIDERYWQSRNNEPAHSQSI